MWNQSAEPTLPIALRLVLTLAGIVSSGGCSVVDPGPDRLEARREIDSRIDARASSDVGDPGGEIEAILADGIQLDECARAAWLSRPEIEQAFSRIGAARAQRVQAGLLPNPTLTAGYLFTDGTGPDKRQFSIAQPIAELFVMPYRIRAAQLLLDAEIRRAASIAVAASFDARAAWRRVRALEDASKIEDESVELAERAVRIAGKRLENGSISDFDVALARSAVAAARASKLEVESELALARAAFSASIGRPSDTRIALLGTEADFDDIDESRARDCALDRRLDARVASIQLAAARLDAEREEGRLFLDVRAGFSFEKVVDRLLGPILSLTLPIFDQGEARIAAARARVEEALHHERATRQRIEGEVCAAVARVRAARARSSLLAELAVPIAFDVASRAQARFEAGADDIDPWLDALGTLLERRRTLARAALELADARSDLERALGAWPIPE